jgi:pimeloyl-ACP methyl ester carboxylesterase
VLAIDLPGHGKSSHYPKGMHYFIFWDGITLIRRIVKYHHWSHVVLLGHSLGGALSFMYASCFNKEDDTAKFISIDIAGPTVRDTEKLASQTGDCIDKMLTYETLPMTKMPCYNYDEMIDLVEDAYAGSVDRESVKVLMKRGMAPAPAHLNKDGFHFARDLRLKVSMMGMFSETQVLTYAKQIRCEMLNIRGKPGMNFGDPNVYPKVIETIRENAKRVVYEEVEGTHHLHLVTPERISKIVGDFLLS